jgi:hypothetical protein
VNDNLKPHPIPDINPLPDALFGGADALEQIDPDEDMLWHRYLPREIKFFHLPIMEKLVARPYHSVILEGPFDIARMVQDHSDKLYRSEASMLRKGKAYIDRLLFTLGEGIFGLLEDEGLRLYAPTPQAAAAAAHEFRRYVKPTKEDKPRFFVISLTPEGPVAEAVIVERSAPVTTDDLALNYGEEFVDWEREWLCRMRQRPSGVTVLHGPPGTGKTSFLRALMNRLIGQAIFYYVPVSECEMLSSPRFVNFWISQTRRQKGLMKVSILEDAEDLLLPRDGGSREKVSNLLNISDGLLGDHLRLHVIATTNIPLSGLDPAIVRPGRLVGTREFRRLTREEACRLAVAKGLPLPEGDDASLAELYCGTATSPLRGGRRIGFG